jgi:ornithine carbamoyltransferase
MKNLISIADLTQEDLKLIFDFTKELKKDIVRFQGILRGKTLALVFQKPSNRTLVSFQVGMYQLGGESVYLSPDEINLGIRESIKDVAKTLSRYTQAIVLRTFEHKNILEMAKEASVPLINGLSDLLHPCQALADIYTIKEILKDTENITLGYVGDGNNVCNSLLYACAKYGIDINLATPKGYEPDAGVLKESKAIAKSNKVTVNIFNQPQPAVEGVDVIYTDVWASMGKEKEAKKRKELFKEFQINKKLMSLAKKDCLVMHCLPAHRGQEITDDVLDSENSVVFDQAENRLHVQKAILTILLKGSLE